MAICASRCRWLHLLRQQHAFTKVHGVETQHYFHIRQSFKPRRQQSHFSTSRSRRQSGNAADDDPAWISVVDRDPVIVKVKEGHGPGILLLALIPITAFALGTWQVKRLQWKTDMIARYEDQLVRDPLPLPPHVNPASIPEFDFRRVVAFGAYRHDQEMLIGPRMRDGEQGYLVVTPLEREDGASKILVCRGWIAKGMREQRVRGRDVVSKSGLHLVAPTKSGASALPAAAGASVNEALPRGEVVVEGLLREPPKKNFVTPDNNPEKGEFYFPDVVQMAKLVGAEPVWVEETMQLEFFEAMRRQERGIPIGREPAVTLSNNHAQYIFTWYALSLATSVMFWMVFKKKPKGSKDRVTRSTEW